MARINIVGERLDCTVRAGVTLRLEAAVTDAHGHPQDLTGWSPVVVDTDNIGLSGSVSGSAVILGLTASQTAALSGEHAYQLHVRDTADGVYPVIFGTISLSP